MLILGRRPTLAGNKPVLSRCPQGYRFMILTGSRFSLLIKAHLTSTEPFQGHTMLTAVPRLANEESEAQQGEGAGSGSQAVDLNSVSDCSPHYPSSLGVWGGEQPLTQALALM